MSQKLNDEMMRLRYSIVVPAYQAATVLGHCLQALIHQSVQRDQYEIIVIDDGSTDDTAAIARDVGADLVVSGPRRGPSGARTWGCNMQTAKSCYSQMPIARQRLIGWHTWWDLSPILW